MEEHPPKELDAIAQIAERNIRQWLLKQEITGRLERASAHEQLADHLGPYITVSREKGTGASEIAHSVGKKLGWDVLGQELLDFMAERYHTPRHLLEFVDETAASWIYEVFGNWINQQAISQEEYVHRLGKIMLLAAHHGNTIFVGRGAQYLLPRAKGLAVRIVAPLEFRIEQVMRRDGLAHKAAKHRVAETDRGRREFIRHYFHHEGTDADLYDLVVNVAKLGTEGASDVIVAAAHIWLRKSD